MTDHSVRPNARATSHRERVAELHRLADEDYASTAYLRNQPRQPLSGAVADAVRDQLRQRSEFEAAVSVAQKMLAAYGDSSGFDEFGYAQAHGALSESLRILLRALGAETEATR